MTIRDERLIRRMEKFAKEAVEKIQRGEFTEQDEKKLRQYLSVLQRRVEELEYLKLQKGRR